MTRRPREIHAPEGAAVGPTVAPRPATRVLALTRYDSLGASSRIRFFQYVESLRHLGVEVDVHSLLDHTYLERRYTGRPASRLQIAARYAQRVCRVLAARSTDVLWIEYELLPWLPHGFERGLLSLGRPYVVEYDDAVFHRYDRSMSAVVRLLLGRKLDRLMEGAAAVIVGNDYLAERAMNAGARVIETIPSVVDLRRYPIGEHALPCPNRQSGMTVGWIGSPTTARYLNDALPAFQRAAAETPIRLVVVGAPGFGAGQASERLEIEARPWSEADEAAQIRAFDVGVMPLPDNAWERGKCGYKLIQYMACAKPVIASPVGVNRSIVEPGVSGWLASTTEEWVCALASARDDALRERMGAAGRARVERDFALDVTAPRLARVLAEAGAVRDSGLGSPCP